MKIHSILARVSAAALVAGISTGTAVAQTVPAAASTPPAPGEANTQASSAAPASPGDEIVVTAQRRTEQLIKVPLSITVLSGARLESAGIKSSMDLAIATPGLTIQPLGGFSQPVLRGVTTTITGVSNPSNIALYIDGIYVTAQDSFDFDFLGVDQVQVLKGPQGSLYGRNATGGVILVTTKKPSFDWTGDGSISYGTFNTSRAQVYLSGPITDTLAFSVAGQVKNSDGYITNITTGNDHAGQNHRETIRGKLLFKPRDGMEFQLSADHTFVRDPTGFLASVLNRNSQALRTAPTTVISSNPWEVNLTFDPQYYTSTSSVSFLGNIDLGGASLNLVSGYRSLKGDTLTDVDYNPLPQSSYERTYTEKSFDQEINLSSRDNGAKFNWVVGLQYAHEDSRNNPVVFNTGATTRNHTSTNYYSAYFDLTYALTDQLSVIGGLRYSDEHKSFDGTTGNPPASPVSSETGSKAFTPRVSLRYAPNDQLSAYLSYNRGFKSGGYNTATSNSLFNGVVTPFRPETIDSYEAGIKVKPATGISFDLAAFYENYRDVQVGISISTNNVPQSITTNAAAERIYGFEGQLRISVVPGLNVQIGGAYTHGTFSSFPNALITVPIAGGGNSQVTADVTGYKIPRNPQFTGTVGVDYTHPTSFGSVFASGNYYHSSGYYYAFNNRLHQNPYDTFNLRAGFGFKGNAFRLSGYVNNLTNKIYASTLFDSPVGDRLVYAPPRTYGITGEFKF